jgi:hypothetical protein
MSNGGRTRPTLLRLVAISCLLTLVPLAPAYGQPTGPGVTAAALDNASLQTPSTQPPW